MVMMLSVVVAVVVVVAVEVVVVVVVEVVVVVVEVVVVAMTKVKAIALTTVASTTALVEVEVGLVNPKLPRKSNLYSLLHIYVQVRT
jgi:hypothetical protein